ncbi:hypothetical protein COAQ111491_13975 [Comamonas aquatilis]|uniref:hypothetical protein n=1 Tax=Comamonas aquatilis TaxID=1778406 RepID=UPI0039EE2260
MSSNDLINAEFSKHGLITNSDPIRDPAGDNRFFVFIHVDFDEHGKQRPSRTAIDAATETLKNQNLVVEVLLVDTRTLDIEAGARASLLHAYPDAVRNVFLSVIEQSVNVWIDAKRSLDEQLRKSIAERLIVYLEQFDLKFESLATLGEGNVPGKLALLRAVRIGAPATLDSVMNLLQASGFTVPSLDWLRRKLDGYRRFGDVLRLGDGTYALKAVTMSAMGSSRTARSPDISRLLALARGKR